METRKNNKICRRCGKQFKPVKIGIHICVDCMKLKEEKINE